MGKENRNPYGLELKRRHRQWVLVTANIVAGIMLALAVPLWFHLATSDSSSQLIWWLAGISTFLFIVFAVWTIVCTLAHSKLKDEQQTEIEKLNGLLESSTAQARHDHQTEVADATARVYDEFQRIVAGLSTDGGALTTAVLTAIKDLSKGHRPRACLYRAAHTDDPDDVEATGPSSTPGLDSRTVNTLNYVDHSGRRVDKPRPDFQRFDNHRHGILSVFDTGKPQHVPDTSRYSIKYDVKNKKYRTFANVRVSFLNDPVGVLSVDSCTANSIEEGDIELMELYGKALAIAIDLIQREEEANRNEILKSGFAALDDESENS